MNIPVNYAAVKFCIKDMKNVLKKSDLLSIKRLIFDFVEKITVYSDHVEVIFKLPVPLDPELVKPAICKSHRRFKRNNPYRRYGSAGRSALYCKPHF